MATSKKKRPTPRRYSTRDKMITLAQEHTQKEIGRMLRISERTVRRWKNEGVEPNRNLRRIERAADRLQHSFERIHKKVVEEIRRERRAHPGAPRIEDRVRVLPSATRRTLKVYRQGRDTGETRSSNWINYGVEKQGIREIFELVRALRDDERTIQIIYRIPKGTRYPTDARGRPGRVVRQSTRTASPLLDLSNLDDNELMDFLLTYVDPIQTPKSRRVLFVSALDKKRRE